MKKLIGDKKFYKVMFAIVIPIVFQQFITQFVSLLDNLMIGRVGNDEMIGVSLANQLIFIFNLAIFGSLSGSSIFATQYFGAKDKEGYHDSFKFKWLVAILITSIACLLFGLFSKELISFFISSNEGDYTNPAIVLDQGSKYLLVMLFGLLPFAIKELYASTMREQKETFVPMVAGIIAILINLLFNYLLIFGKLGFPEMGVIGAAIATVISRIVEMLIVMIYVGVKKEKFSILQGVFKDLRIKASSIKMFTPKVLLLMSNEILWSLGLTLIIKCYSIRGLDIVGALNISNTVNNLFLIVGNSFGTAASIILGNLIGENKIDEAKDTCGKIIFTDACFVFLLAFLQFSSAFIVPNLYNTSEGIKLMAKEMIIISAIYLTFHGINASCYFTMRTGGKILLTMCFDSIFLWVIRLPFAYVLCKFTNLDELTLKVLIDGIDAMRFIVGIYLVKKGIWLNKLV